MEKLAHKLAEKISINLKYDEERQSIISYGLTALIQMIVTVTITALLGYIFNVLLESLILTFSVSLLRKYSGGVHANSIELCTTISVIYCVGFALISKHFLTPYLNQTIMIIVGCLVFIFSFYTITKRAPVDSPNKPIKSSEKRKRMRSGSYKIMTTYVVLATLFIYLSESNTYWVACFMSLMFGILWQISTLTKFGANMIGVINRLFIKNI